MFSKVRYKFGKWLNASTDDFVNRLVEWKCQEPIHLWGETEWNDLLPKQKVWLWYKDVWYLKNSGSGEVDQFTNPIKDTLLYGGIITTTITLLLLYAKIQVNPITILLSVAVLCLVAYVLNFILQWRLGNWKDKKGLIPLEQELNNRRDLFCKELRQKML